MDSVAQSGASGRVAGRDSLHSTRRDTLNPEVAWDTAVVKVSEHGVGPVQIGMTLAHASAVSAHALVAPSGADTAVCGFATWEGGPASVRFMTARGRIVRVDVGSGAVATEAGARIGDDEERIVSLYRGRVQITPSKYTSGHYLTVRGAEDSLSRLIFETSGKRVSSFRAGRLPEVAFVEGCG